MTVSSLVCAPRSAGASRAEASRTIEASVMPRFIAPSSEEWRSSYPRVGIASNPAAPRQGAGYPRKSSQVSSQAWVVSASDSTSTRSSLPWNRPAIASAVRAREKRPNP